MRSCDEATGRTPDPKKMADWNWRTVAPTDGNGGNWVPSRGALPSEPTGLLTTLETGTPRAEERLNKVRSGRSSAGPTIDWACTRATQRNATRQENGIRRLCMA